METWREIIGFPGYSVSDGGHVKNDYTDRVLAIAENTRGIAIVGLSISRDNRRMQLKRSVALLVANAFVTHARSLRFDTPINLDGDRFNNRAANLAWRPLWFARKYFQQFKVGPQSFHRPVQELKTGEVFSSPWEAAITYGLLEQDVTYSVMSHTYVVPTYQKFRLLSSD